MKTTLQGRVHVYELLISLYVTVLIISNIASIKLVGMAGFVFDAGTILFPIAYILSDIITEVYGFKKLRSILFIGIGMLLLTTLTFWIVGLMPAASGWTLQDSYTSILGTVWRIVFASITAIFFGELINAYVLAKMKIKSKGAKLWQRLIGSSAVGNLVDTLVFSLIAFGGILDTSTLFTLIGTVYLIKMATEIVVSPLTMRIISSIKRHENIDTYEDPELFTHPS